MKTQYTPGPWFIGDLSVSEIVDKDRRHICRLDGLGPDSTRKDQGERNANARLISLAPEMADALRDVLGFLEDMAEDYSDYGIPEKRDRVRSLLSRLD